MDAFLLLVLTARQVFSSLCSSCRVDQTRTLPRDLWDLPYPWVSSLLLSIRMMLFFVSATFFWWLLVWGCLFKFEVLLGSLLDVWISYRDMITDCILERSFEVEL